MLNRFWRFKDNERKVNNQPQKIKMNVNISLLLFGFAYGLGLIFWYFLKETRWIYILCFGCFFYLFVVIFTVRFEFKSWLIFWIDGVFLSCFFSVPISDPWIAYQCIVPFFEEKFNFYPIKWKGYCRW